MTVFSNAKELEKLVKNKGFLAIFISVLFLFTPGFLVIYHFKPNLFLELSDIKLALLSVSFLAPFVVTNIFFSVFDSISYFLGEEGSPKDKDHLFLEVLFAIWTSGLLLYGLLFSAWLFEKDFEFLLKLWLQIELGLVGSSVVIDLWRTRKTQKKTKKK